MEQGDNFVELLLCRRHCVGAVHILYLLYSLQPYKGDIIIYRELRSRQLQWLVQGHPAILWQRRNSSLGLSGSSVCSNLFFGSLQHRFWVGQSSASILLRAGAHLRTTDDSSSSVSSLPSAQPPAPLGLTWTSSPSLASKCILCPAPNPLARWNFLYVWERNRSAGLEVSDS